MAKGKIIAIDQNIENFDRSESELIKQGIVHGFVKVVEAKIGEHVGLGAQLPFFSAQGCGLNDLVNFEVETNDKIDKFAGSVSCAVNITKID